MSLLQAAAKSLASGLKPKKASSKAKAKKDKKEDKEKETNGEQES